MKERIALSKSVDIGGDLQATAFKVNYIYLHEDGIMVYFDPSHIPSMKLAYPEQDVADSAGQVLMPKKVADDFKDALSAALALCKGRMETPYVAPVKEAAAEDVRGNGGHQ